MKSENNGSGSVGTVAYDYDAAGRRIRITWPDSFYVEYDYDNTGAVIGIRRMGGASTSDKIAGYTYDDLGRRAGITRGAPSGAGAATSYAYTDPLNLQLSRLTHTPANSGDAVTFGFTYNIAGQIKTRTVSNSAYVWNGAYAVDRPYAIDGLNRVNDAGAKPAAGQTAPGYSTYSYDDRGNLKCVGTV